MMRRRPNESTDVLRSPGNDKDDKKPASPSAAGAASASSGATAVLQDASAALLSNKFVFSICLFFICLGFLQEHFRASRSKDPFLRIGNHHLMAAQHKIQEQARHKQLKAHMHNTFLHERALHDKAIGGDVGGATKQSLLTTEEDASLEFDTAHNNLRYHLIFSTDCSPYQHWQSYLVFYTAMKVHQTGHVTRIASGCEEEEGKAMQEWFEQNIQYMSPSGRFHLSMTPNFSLIKNEQGEVVGDYKFFNKPFGLKYWMEHDPILGFNSEDETFSDDSQRDVVMLIDPDMALLRPIDVDFSDDRQTIISAARQKHIIARSVAPGKPFAQVYGFGAQWNRLDLAKITNDPDTPAAKVTNEEGLLFYPVGPPYIAMVPDMYRIAKKWTEFVPGTYDQYPHLLAEMFAFCIAAAHLEMPFQLINSLMISDVSSGGNEGWPLIDKIPADQVCSVAREILDRPGGPQTNANDYFLPSVVHLCQRYMVGEDWFFSKRALPPDIYDCEAPLLAEPPKTIALDYNYKLPPGGEKTALNQKEVNRNTFMVCFLSRLVNEAAEFYKRNNGCDANAQVLETRNLAHYTREKHGGHHKHEEK